MINELDRVVLTADVPECGLGKGDTGTVVSVYEEEDGYEVEFIQDGGKRTVITLLQKEISAASSTPQKFDFCLVTPKKQFDWEVPFDFKDMQTLVFVASALDDYCTFLQRNSYFNVPIRRTRVELKQTEEVVSHKRYPAQPTYKVSHVPLLGEEPFEIFVPHLVVAKFVMETLALFDLWLVRLKLKPETSNINWLSTYSLREPIDGGNALAGWRWESYWTTWETEDGRDIDEVSFEELEELTQAVG